MISRTSALLSSLTTSSISTIRKICTDSFNNLDACSVCSQPPPTVLQPEVRIWFWIQIDNAELKLSKVDANCYWLSGEYSTLSNLNEYRLFELLYTQNTIHYSYVYYFLLSRWRWVLRKIQDEFLIILSVNNENKN